MGGRLKKIREKGGSRKILPLLEGGRGKKISYWGGSCNFLMTLQKMNGPLRRPHNCKPGRFTSWKERERLINVQK